MARRVRRVPLALRVLVVRLVPPVLRVPVVRQAPVELRARVHPAPPDPRVQVARLARRAPVVVVADRRCR